MIRRVPLDGRPSSTTPDGTRVSFNMRISLIAVAMTIVVAAAASPAGAFERRVPGLEIDGVALAGSAVLNARVRGRHAVVVRIPMRGRGSRVLFRRAPLADEDTAGVASLSASRHGYGFVFSNRDGFTGATFGAAFARPFGAGAAARFGNCQPTDVDVHGKLAVAGACGIRLADLGSGAAPSELTPPPASSPRVAGSFVSWVQPGDAGGPPRIVVRDRTTSRTGYEVPLAGRLGDYDLQADGAIVFGIVTSERAGGEGGRLAQATRVYWSTPAQPAPQPVALPVAEEYRLRAAEGRIAWLRADFDFPPRSAVVGTIRPGARSPRHVDRYAYTPGLDFDGRRLAWVSRRRGGLYVVVERV